MKQEQMDEFSLKNNNKFHHQTIIAPQQTSG
jgi:hypothetical protein